MSTMRGARHDLLLFGAVDTCYRLVIGHGKLITTHSGIRINADTRLRFSLPEGSLSSVRMRDIRFVGMSLMGTALLTPCASR